MRYRILAVSLLLALVSSAGIAQCNNGGPSRGTAFASSIINWSQTGDLYFTVVGGPPNVCGALATTRNNQCLYNSGWICTDANGGVTRGPWRWVDQAGDQSDTDIHFDWPDGTTTYFTTNHYWDKTCPTPAITSPNGRPPISFYGTGDDGVGGGGFGSWTQVKPQFKDNTTGLYWDPATGDYTASTPPDITATNTSGIGSVGPGTSDNVIYHMTWSATSIPDAHQTGHSYTWDVVLLDGDSRCQEHAPIPIQFVGPRNGCVPSIDNPCP
jgi:hypothetical protein